MSPGPPLLVRLVVVPVGGTELELTTVGGGSVEGFPVNPILGLIRGTLELVGAPAGTVTAGREYPVHVASKAKIERTKF